MPPQLALLLGFAFVWWLFHRDMRWRHLPSRALWIPGIWLALVSSRQPAFWLSMAGVVGGTSSNLEGSPINAMFNSGLFLSAIVVLHRRGFRWGSFSSSNKGLVLIYVFFLSSVLWSAFPIPTARRLVLDFGSVVTGLVLLTEQDPAISLRVVFVRVSYLLFPLSVVFIRYFPQIGRNVSSASGTHMLCGVADHKNTLGQMAMVFCLVLLWDLMETRKRDTDSLAQREISPRLLNLVIGLYLLIICDSVTALLCCFFGVAMLFGGQRLARMQNPRKVIMAGVLSFTCALILNQTLGLSDNILSALGRDATLTGRTDIWRAILEKNPNHLIGAGFRGFWESSEGESVSDELAGNRLLTAHNGYLEVYLYGGLLALFLLSVWIWTTGLNAVNKLVRGDPIGRVAVYCWPILLIYDVTESAFFLTGPLWFTTLLATIDSPWQAGRAGVIVPGSPRPLSARTVSTKPAAAGVREPKRAGMCSRRLGIPAFEKPAGFCRNQSVAGFGSSSTERSISPPHDPTRSGTS